MNPADRALALLSKKPPAEAVRTWKMQMHICTSPILITLCDFCQASSHTLFLCFSHQSILNSDETTHLLENLEPDTPYDVSVTAIYPDESESEDLLGTERTCKTPKPRRLHNLLN